MITQLRGWRVALLIVCLALVAWLVMDFNSRLGGLNRLNRERDAVLEHYQQVQGTKTALEAELKFSASDAAIEKWAYEEGHMARSGDYMIIPLSTGGSVPVPTPKPALVQPQVSQLEGWKALFLGPRNP